MKNQITILFISLLLASISFQCARRSTGGTNFQEYVGTYKINSDQIGSAVITLENGQLYAEAAGQPRTQLKPDSGDTFTVPNIGAKVVFTRSDNQKVNGVRISYRGYDFTGEKVE